MPTTSPSPVYLVSSGDLRSSANASDVFSSWWRKSQGNQQAWRGCVEQDLRRTGKTEADLGRARVIELPNKEVERRWNITTPQWPIMNAVLLGVTRDQMMARHKANHIQVAYAESEQRAAEALEAKAACFKALGIDVSICGAVLR
jgi:hypothetical protein